MGKVKAIFLDRDGVINELIYYEEQGIVDSPFTVEQFRLLSGAGETINKFHELGFRVILVSNQPGIAKGHLSEETFGKIRHKMKNELAREEAFLDGEYYCFHHPEARVEKLKANCECRKPKPGLLLQAAKDMDIDLSKSWMVGDGLIDIKAGKSAGCKTILLGKMKCELCRLMDEEDARPDFVVSDLLEAAREVEEVLSLRSSDKPTQSPGSRTSDIEHRTPTKAIQRFEDIEAWKEARKLVNMVYDVSNKEPLSKDFSLKNQIHGASVSIISNIAEGFDHSSDREFTQFLVIARASASEVKSQLYVALDRGYIGENDFKVIYQQANSVISLLNGFIRYLKKPRPRPRT